MLVNLLSSSWSCLFFSTSLFIFYWLTNLSCNSYSI